MPSSSWFLPFFPILNLKDFNDPYIGYFQRVWPVIGREWLVHLHIFQPCSALQYKNIFLHASNFFFFILWVSYSVHSPSTFVEKMRWEQFKENHSKFYLKNKKTSIKLLRVEEINNLETFLTIWAFLMGKDETILTSNFTLEEWGGKILYPGTPERWAFLLILPLVLSKNC